MDPCIIAQCQSPKGRRRRGRGGAGALRRPWCHNAAAHVAEAEGARITDVNGRSYIDFAGGIGCQNTGHRHAAIVEAVKEQADRYLHQCFIVGTYEPYVEVCRRLAELSPCGQGEQRSLLVNSGAEAVENAVKIARSATGRQAVVVFDGAFHGRTLLAMTMTSKVKPYKAGFGPFAPRSIERRRPTPTTGSRPTTRSLRSNTSSRPTSIRRRLPAWSRAGAGGRRLRRDALGLSGPPAGAVSLVRDPVCRRRGAVRDRAHGNDVGDRAVRGGRARPPDLWEVDRWRPPTRGRHGSRRDHGCSSSRRTRRNLWRQPAFVRRGTRRIRHRRRRGVPRRCARLGEMLRARLDALAGKHREIGEVRGLGSMLAFEFAERSPDRAKAVVDAAFERGLILLSCGLYGNVIRLLPPLNIAPDELDEGLAILEESLGA